MRSALVILAAVVAAPVWALQGARNGAVMHPLVRVDDPGRATCNVASAQNAKIADAIAEATGGTLFVPKNCVLTLGSPGIASSGVVLPAGTTLECEDPTTSGFALARRSCISGSYVGAACATDTDCRGGTCGCDEGSGSSCMYAPTAGLPYGVVFLGTNTRLVGCGLWIRQLDPYGTCVGGADANLPCVSSANCSGGYCGYETRQPSGPGDIWPVDGSGADVRVERVRIYDHKTGPFSFSVEAGGLLRDVNNTLTATTVGRCEGGSNEGEACSPAGFNFACGGTNRCTPPTRDVDHGVKASGSRARVYDSTIGGTRSSVHIAAGTIAVKVQGNDLLPWGTGTAGVLYGGSQGIISNNQMGGHRSCLEVERQGINSTFEGNHCLESIGPKLVIQNAGHAILRNYLAWGPTGVCDSGARAGKPCTTDDTARGTGCPGATCPNCCDAPSQAVEVGAPASMTSGHWQTTHLELIGNRLHTNTGGAQPMIKFLDGPKRCDNGARIGLACTLDSTDATNGCGADAQCPGCCDSPLIDSIQIAANHIYTGASVVGVDLSALTSGATASAQDIVISGNQATIAGGTFIKMPTSVGKVTDVLVIGNGMVEGTTFAANWDWRFGERRGNTGIPTNEAEEPQITRVENYSGSTIAAGTLVQFEAGATNPGRITAATGPTTVPAGVALHSCASGGACWIAVDGWVTVTATSGAGTAIAVGDKLTHDGAAPGGVKKAGSTDVGIGYARASKADGQTSVAMLFRVVPPSSTSVSYPVTIATRTTSGVVNASTAYIQPLGTAAGGTETSNDTPVPAQTVYRMACTVDPAPGSGKSRTCTLRDNGATVTGWTCTISGTAKSCCITTAASGCDTNGVTAGSFAAGDMMSIQTTPSGTPATANEFVTYLSTVVGAW